MSDSGRLQTDPLFQGLTRPPMLMGVSYPFFVFNALVGYITFIWTHNLLILFILLPTIHTTCYLVCLKEPRMMELMMLKAAKGMRGLNWKFHGYTNSYDVF